MSQSQAPEPILYSFGEVVIEGKSYHHDLKLIQRKVIPDWWREKGHFLQFTDIQDILDYHPKILVIGSGAFGVMKISPELSAYLQEIKIKTIVEKTGIAVSIYNKLSPDHKIAGAFHLTC